MLKVYYVLSWFSTSYIKKEVCVTVIPNKFYILLCKSNTVDFLNK